ncbi:MAG: hypothetical protein AAGF95_35080 [Chloroflexota bacterium]
MKRQATADGVFMTWWMVANVLPLAVGWHWLGTTIVDYPGGVTVILFFLQCLVFIGQWLILRRYLSVDHWWLTASVAGLLVGFVAGAFVGGSVNALIGSSGFDVALFIIVSITGGVLGLVQMLVLGRFVQSSRWWIPASTVGWLAPFVVIILVGHNLDYAVMGLFNGALFGCVYGIITGVVLLRLVCRKRTFSFTHTMLRELYRS